MECKEHPLNKGLRIPRNGCEACMALYNHNKGMHNEETRPTIEADTKSEELKKEEKVSSEEKSTDTIQGKSQKDSNAIRRKGSERRLTPAYEDESGTVSLQRSAKESKDNEREADIVQIHITVDEAMAALGKKADEVLSSIIDKRLADAKLAISKELDISYEHLWLIDAGYSSAVLKNLENEGWQFCFYSYPLAKNGIIPGGKEHFTFKRLKRSINKPIPDFSNPSVLLSYNKLRN